MKVLWLSLGVCAILSAGVTLSAQDKLPTYRISDLYAAENEETIDEGAIGHAAIAPGLSIGGRASLMNDPDVDIEKGEWFGGATVRLHIFKMLSVEAFGAWHREDFDGAEANIFPVQLSVLVYLTPDSPVAVYVCGGVNWTFFEVQFDHPFEDFDFEETEFGYHAGLGIDFQIARHFSITIDGRYIWFKDSDSFIPAVTNQDEAYQIMGGFNFDF